MAERGGPQIYSIAAHRGFADALVAGLGPRYSEGDLGLARLTLLLPSSRAMRTVSEAFIRHYGSRGERGMLMPRMVAVGDLDLDEALGPLLDPLGTPDIPPAVDATQRRLHIAHFLAEEMGEGAPRGSALLRLARETARTMDRLLVEEIGPEELLQDRVLDIVQDQSQHWQDGVRLFARVQQHWLVWLERHGRIDASARRNRLFRHAAERWRAKPPATPIVAAGVTSAAPALARLLRTVSEMPLGAVILPDLDLTMDVKVWDELGCAGAPNDPGDPPFERGDAVTHPQYHLKLLLNRMGVARGEVQAWHRKGEGAAPPERSHAISALFLPPEASKSWVDLPSEKRRLSGVRMIETANPEAEAQCIALLVREALETPEKRVAVVTPDRGLAGRVVQHLRRWNIAADDTAGRSLSLTPAGRLLLQLAECVGEEFAPVPLMALLASPLVKAGEERRAWLAELRAFEKELRGPRPAAGLEPLAEIAKEAGCAEWWQSAGGSLQPLALETEELPLADWLDRLAETGEALCGEDLWSREDGRALSAFVENLREHARDVGAVLARGDLHTALIDAMDEIAVRPPYGSHPRVAIYGLLESRMTRSDLVICGGLNEGVWPASPAPDPLLAPPVLRGLGVPGADFRIGLAAHDLAGAMGALEVVLTRARRDASGPTIASRFLLRVRALLGPDMIERHEDDRIAALAEAIDKGERTDPHPKPEPDPSAEQRMRPLSVTSLDRLRSDPYQFYASSILSLSELDALDAEPSPAWQGEVAHAILEKWHDGDGALEDIAERELEAMHAHPVTRALWRPRLMRALEWVKVELESDPSRTPVEWEEWGRMEHRGVKIRGRIDRLDKLEDGSFAVVDYKTGSPPSGAQVEEGYALQLGTLGLMVQAGAFKKVSGDATRFEYWSLARSDKSDTGFGYVSTPILEGRKRRGIPLEDFLPESRRYLDEALDKWILGTEPFTARLNPDAAVYSTYDQLMRLDEWMGREE